MLAKFYSLTFFFFFLFLMINNNIKFWKWENKHFGLKKKKKNKYLLKTIQLTAQMDITTTAFPNGPIKY